jgi:hypothetical protein
MEVPDPTEVVAGGPSTYLGGAKNRAKSIHQLLVVGVRIDAARILRMAGPDTSSESACRP